MLKDSICCLVNLLCFHNTNTNNNNNNNNNFTSYDASAYLPINIGFSGWQTLTSETYDTYLRIFCHIKPATFDFV
jgi:hypothetical protein